MKRGPASDDRVWRALASPVRRRILDVLRRGETTTGEVAALFPRLSRYAVMQHLRVLAEADLVLVRRQGRVRWNSLNVAPLQRAFQRWVTPYQAMWAGKMLAIRERAEAGSGRARAEEKA